MASKSIKVPQPAFSDWIIKKRQAFDLSPGCLKEKADSQISERTLKYLEGGRKDSFSEYTLSVLARCLDLSFPELLQEIDALQNNASRNGILREKLKSNKTGLLLLSSALLALFLFFVLRNSHFKTLFLDGEPQHDSAVYDNGMGRLQDVLVHRDYPHIFIAYDGRGNILWQRNLKTKVQKVEPADLDGDGSSEVLAATLKHGPEDKGERPGWLFLYDETGELITELNLWKSSIYPAEEPYANVQDFKIVDLENDGVLEIVAIVRGYQYYPSRLAVLHYNDSKLTEIKSYWNPGYLLKLFIEDVNNDGFPEIICTGVNNDFKRVSDFQLDDNVFSIFMLDGRSILGQAPPYLGSEPHGGQLWYRYITPSGSYRSEIVEVMFMGEGEKTIYVELRDSCIYYLNYYGEIVERFEGDICKWETELHLVSNEKSWE